MDGESENKHAVRPFLPNFIMIDASCRRFGRETANWIKFLIL